MRSVSIAYKLQDCPEVRMLGLFSLFLDFSWTPQVPELPESQDHIIPASHVFLSSVMRSVRVACKLQDGPEV